MTQAEFETACAEAIKEWHDPKLDGPLLVGTRTMSNFSATSNEWEEPWTEFAACIGHWPVGYLGESALEFDQSHSEIITSLVKEAKRIWQERQPEEETTP